MIIKIKMLNERRTFLQKHKGWIAFIGTVILFGTFVVNEAFRDRAKELADAIGRAQNTSAILLEIQNVTRQVDHTRESLTMLHSKVDHLKAGQPSTARESHPDLFVWATQLNAPTYMEYAAELHASVTIFEQLPYDMDLDTRRRSLLSLTDTASKMVAEADDIQNLQNQGKSEEAIRERAKLGESATQVSQLVRQLNADSYVDAISKFERDVASRAEKVQSDAEDRVRFWKHVSFGLYPLGLIVGLIGRLSGDTDSEGEEVGD